MLYEQRRPETSKVDVSVLVNWGPAGCEQVSSEINHEQNEAHSRAGILLYADADDQGLSFILPSLKSDQGGLACNKKHGHFSTLVGRGGSGKSILALQLATALLQRVDSRVAAIARQRLRVGR